MNTFQKQFVVGVLAIGLLSACGGKKEKNGYGNSQDAETEAPALKKEVSAQDAKMRAAKEQTADSLRKVDSLRQVKEHGHAH